MISCRNQDLDNLMKKILIYFVLVFSTSSLLSQSCSVSVDSLKGQYIGNCRKGKAEGKGTAIGIVVRHADRL